MGNPFGFTKERAAEAVKEVASLMHCDYKDLYKVHTKTRKLLHYQMQKWRGNSIGKF